MKIETPIDYLRDKFSFSKLECFSRCPRRAFLRYVQKLKLPSEMSWRMLLGGRAIHGGMEADAYAKLRGERLTLPQVLEAAVNVFEDERKKENVPGKEAPVDDFAREHYVQLEVFEKSGARARIQPIPGSVEAGYQLTLQIDDQAPLVFEGYIDVASRTEEDPATVVVDYKSGGRALSQKQVDENIQLAAGAIGGLAERFRIVNFVAGKRQKPTCKVPEEVVLSEDRRTQTLQWIGGVASEFRAALKSGDFPKCSPASWWCGASQCEYYSKCYPKPGEELPRLVSVSKIVPIGELPAADWRQSLAAKQEAERQEEA